MRDLFDSPSLTEGSYYVMEKYEWIKDHNYVSNDRAQKLLKKNRICLITQATGTGKSYQAFQIIHDMCVAEWTGSTKIKILVIVPTDALIREWTEALSKGGKFEKSYTMKEAREKSFSKKFKGDSVKIGYTFEVASFSSMSNVGKIEKDKRTNNYPPLNDSQKRAISDYVRKYNLIIIDEAHHVGADSYSLFMEGLTEAIVDRADSRHYVLGMTATPYNKNNPIDSFFRNSVVKGVTLKQAQQGTYPVYDKNGEVVVKDSEKILPKTKTYPSFVFDKRLQVSRVLKAQYINWAKGIPKKDVRETNIARVEMAFSLMSSNQLSKLVRSKLLRVPYQKILVFYQEGENPKAVKDFAKEIFGISKVVDVHSSSNSKQENKDAFDAFKEKQDVVLCAIDKVSEGVHINGVTAICLLRRTFSANKIIQQIGRAMDYENRDKVIPVFDVMGTSMIAELLDIEDDRNEDLQEFLNSEANTKEFSPEFLKAKALLNMVVKDCEAAKVKKPPSRVKGNDKDRVFNMMGLLLVKYDTLSEWSMEGIRGLLNSVLTNKHNHGAALDLDESFMSDEFIQDVYLFKKKGKMGSSYGSPLYSLVGKYVDKYGKFPSKSDMRDFCISCLNFSGKGLKKLDTELNKKMYNSYYVTVLEGAKADCAADLLLESLSDEASFNEFYSNLLSYFD